jgi:pyruvate/2-oxoglutarate dehydrogenase complex dihydrolipoamide acyltransferase (E2) component
VARHVNITLPKLTDKMTHGAVLRWLVREGARIRKGDLVAEVQTDKANMQVESGVEGRLKRFAAKLGIRYPIGTPLIVVETEEQEPTQPETQTETTSDGGEVICFDQERIVRNDNLTRAWRETPVCSLSCSISLEKSIKIVEDYNPRMEEEQRIPPERVVLGAIARALPQFPLLCSRFENQQVHMSKKIRMGYIMEIDGREITAALDDVDSMLLPQLLGQLSSLESKAQHGLLEAEQLAGGTIAVQALPAWGAELFFSPPLPPAVARIGVPGIGPGNMQQLALSVDSRVITPLYASNFLGEVRQRMDNPLALML